MKKIVLSLLLVVSSVFAFENYSVFLKRLKMMSEYRIGDIVDKYGLIVGEGVCVDDKYLIRFRVANMLKGTGEIKEFYPESQKMNDNCYAIAHGSMPEDKISVRRLKEDRSLSEVLGIQEPYGCIQFEFRYEYTNKNGKTTSAFPQFLKCAKPHNVVTTEFPYTVVTDYVKKNITMAEMKDFVTKTDAWNESNGITGYLIADGEGESFVIDSQDFLKITSGAWALGPVTDVNGFVYADLSANYDYKSLKVKGNGNLPSVRVRKGSDIEMSLIASEYYNKYRYAYKKSFSYGCGPSNSGFANDEDQMGFIYEFNIHKETGDSFMIAAWPTLGKDHTFNCDPELEDITITDLEAYRLINLGKAVLKPVFVK